MLEEENMWPFLIAFATAAGLCSIVSCRKKKKVMQSVERVQKRDSKETMEKLTAESDKKSAEPNIPQLQPGVAPPHVAPAPAPPHRPPPPPPPAAQPNARPAPPQPAPLPLPEGGDDVGYEMCPDMTPEELAKVIPK